MIIVATFSSAWERVVAMMDAVGLWTTSLLSSILYISDIRNWTWKVFAALSATAILALLGIRTWLQR